MYQDTTFDNNLPRISDTPHQVNNVQQQPSPYALPPINNVLYNTQTPCDYSTYPQGATRQTTYTPTSFLNCPELDMTNWLPDPRVIADIEGGLRYSDKIEAIEITSKDLSPVSCCSNMDFMMDLYKKDTFYGKTADTQWYCNASFGNQKVDFAPLPQLNIDAFIGDDRSKYFSKPYSGQDTCYNQKFNSDSSFVLLEPQCTQDTNRSVSEKDPQIDIMFNDTYSCNYKLPDYTSELHQLYSTSQLPEPSFSTITDDIDVGGTEEEEESDIVVEETDEEIDFSEGPGKKFDYSTNCIVCNILYTPIGSQFYILTAESPLTMSTQQPVFKKLTEMVGTLNRTCLCLCADCLSLINTIDHLQMKLETSRFEFFEKFEKTCKETNTVFNMSSNTDTVARPVKNKKFKSFCGVHSFKCKLCKKLFSIKKLYKNHMMRHKSENRYLCEQCGVRFTKISKFRFHLKSHKNVKKVKLIAAFECQICRKAFRTKGTLKEHVNFCSGKLPFACSHTNCDKKFATSTKLKNHVKLKHDKKFVAICSICNVGFVKQSDYKLHKTSHSPDKKFTCTVCGKSYKTQSYLNYHAKFHNDKLPFICTICDRGFMRKDYLDTHLNNHNGVKNFSCQICSKQFVSQKNLDAHLKYHEGTGKKKVCNVCNKTITSNFEEHLRIHTNLKEFECQVCQMKFNTKGTLTKHLKRKHNNED